MSGPTGSARPERSRRAFLAACGGVLLATRPLVQVSTQDSFPPTGPAGRLYDPGRAGRPQQPTDARDSDPAVQALEKRIHCTCGCGLDVYTCRTTDFTCTVSPAMHREVLALLDRGLTADEVVADFVSRHGPSVLMAPPKRGFNLAGYWVPSIAIVGVGALLLVALRRWTRMQAVAAAAAPPPADATPEELERLRRELEEFSD